LPYGAPRSGAIGATERGWIGQTKDASTGLQYLNARYYDPAIGRFTATDPLADLAKVASLDAYGYGHGSPATLTDPTGLYACDDPRDCRPSTGLPSQPRQGSGGGGSGGTGGGGGDDAQAAADAFICGCLPPDPSDPLGNDGWVSPVTTHWYETAFYNFVFDSSRCDDTWGCTWQTGKFVLAVTSPLSFVRRGGGMLLDDAASYGDELVKLGRARSTIAFTDDTVGSAYQGLNRGGGHAIRHLAKEGLIPRTGSLASQVSAFKDLTATILKSPLATFNWKVGATQARAFAGQSGGVPIVVFVAREGPFQGRVLSAIVPTAEKMVSMGL
jgi:RHS repeat-associated protein